MRRIDFVTCLVILATCAATVSAATIQVGPTRTYQTVAAGYNAASNGDVIEIDSGTYYQSAGWVYVNGKNNLTFRGVGATRPVLDAGGSNLKSKGIFVIEIGTSGTVIENLELKNARFNPDVAGSNAAGVRAQGTGLTLRNCYIHDCDDGVLNGAGDMLFEYCEFYHNGQGDGQSHNIYIGTGTNSFTMQYCYSHGTVEGHEVKTRANNNYILYNLIITEGTGSREIQFAQGGNCYAIGNVVVKGSGAHNPEMITYGGEGTNGNPNLYVINNTLINYKGGATGLSVANPPSVAVLQNNIMQSVGSVTGGSYAGSVTSTTNWITGNAYLVNSSIANLSTFDAHLTVNSTGAIDVGTAPGTGYAGYSLTPIYQYVAPCNYQARPTSGTIDIGAYEYYVAPVNTAPTVDAGQNIAVAYENMPVSLHAVGTDADNDTLTYAWTQTAGQAVLSPSGAATADYSFTTPVLTARTGGTMTFRVDVNDGHGGSANDSVNVTVYMAGDANHDWFVNVSDLQALVAAWGSDNTGSWGNWDANTDFNGDGFVNVGDLQLLVANWGRNL